MAGLGIGEAALIFSAVTAAASATATYAGAQQQAAQQRTQARMADFNATTEAIRGQIQANQVRETLMRTLAAQSARYAGSGLALEGTPDLVAEQTVAQANRELTMTETNTVLRSEQLRQRARLLEDDAGATELGGTTGAVINLFDTASRTYSRFPGSTSSPGGGWGSVGGGTSSSRAA
jgi:hypothetical protein